MGAEAEGRANGSFGSRNGVIGNFRWVRTQPARFCETMQRTIRTDVAPVFNRRLGAFSSDGCARTHRKLPTMMTRDPNDPIAFPPVCLPCLPYGTLCFYRLGELCAHVHFAQRCEHKNPMRSMPTLAHPAAPSSSFSKIVLPSQLIPLRVCGLLKIPEWVTISFKPAQSILEVFVSFSSFYAYYI